MNTIVEQADPWLTITPGMSHDHIARALMLAMMLSNGAINRLEPHSERRYHKEHLIWITAAAGAFFDAHPEFLTEEMIDEIADGDNDENESRFGIFPEWQPLNDALNEFFDVM